MYMASKMTSELFESVSRGDLATLRSLIQRGINIDAPSSDDSLTALMRSAKQGSSDIISLLLENKANVNSKNSKGMTALHVAAWHGRSGPAELLLDAGASIDDLTINKDTALHHVCRGKTKHVTEDDEQERLKIIKLLLEKGASVNNRGNLQSTPLILAIKERRALCAAYLLQHGADIRVTDTFGKTSLIQASKTNQSQLLQKILEKDASLPVITAEERGFLTALHMSAYKGHQKCIDCFLAFGVSIDLRNSRMETPLMCAIKGGQVKMVDYLLKKGANPNLLDMNRSNAVMSAVLTQRNDKQIFQIISKLLQFNSDVTSKSNAYVWGEDDGKFYTALERVTRDGYLPIVTLLLESGCPTSDVRPYIDEIPHDQLPPLLQENSCVIDALRGYITKPRSLTEISCTVVRNILGTNIIAKVECLDVPVKLKNILCLKKLNQIVEQLCEDIESNSFSDESCDSVEEYGDSGEECDSDDSV